MSGLDFDPATAYLAAGFLYVIMPLAAWVVMGKSRTLAAGVWCGGSLALGLGALLLALRTPDMPGWLAFGVMNAFFYGGNLLHVMGLRMELDRHPAWRTALLTGLLMLGVQEFFRLGMGSAVSRLGWVLLAMGTLFAWTAWLAWQVHKREDSISARWLMRVYIFGAAATLLRSVLVFLGASSSDPLSVNWESVLTTCSLFVMSVFGSVAFLGLYLERSTRNHVATEVALQSQKTLQMLSQQMADVDRQRSMGELSGALAHELAQPLTAVSTECGLLQRKLAQDYPQAIDQLQSIASHVDWAVKVLQGIRRFILPSIPDFKAVNLRAVVQDVLQLWSISGQKNVAISVISEEKDAWVDGDVVQLSQVLLNVLRNAAQAQLPALSVRIDLTLKRVGSRFHVVVEDNGPGFQAHVLATKDVTFASTKKGGMGIGLSISRRIVLQHGGDLLLGNREDASGARVVLVLPALQVFKEDQKQ